MQNTEEKCKNLRRVSIQSAHPTGAGTSQSVFHVPGTQLIQFFNSDRGTSISSVKYVICQTDVVVLSYQLVLNVQIKPVFEEKTASSVIHPPAALFRTVSSCA